MISFQRILGGALVVQLLLTTTAFGATNPSYLAPANSFVYLESNTAQENPLKGQLADLLRQAGEDMENQATLNAIADNIDQTTIAISTAFHQDGSDIYFLSMALDEDDFQTIIDELTDKDLIIKDLGQNNIIYLTGDDFYFTHKDGNLLASNREGMVSDLLLVHNPDSIGKTADWQFLNGKSSGREFLRGLINFRQMPDSLAEEENLPFQLTDLIESESFAIEQTSSGFKGIVSVKSGSMMEKLSTRPTFVPELYKKLRAEGVLFHSESFDLASGIVDTIELFSAMSGQATESDLEDFYAAFEEEILAATGLNLEKQITPLLRNRFSLSIHDESELQMAPAFTLLSDVKGNETLARETLAAMHSQLQKNMQDTFDRLYDQELAYREELKQYFNEDPSYTPTTLPDRQTLNQLFFQQSSQTVNGTVFNQLTFDPEANMYFYQDDYQPNPKTVFTLSSGVTSDGLLILTTSKNLNTLLSGNGGIGQDSEWQKSYQGGSMLEINFLQLDNLGSYIEKLAITIDPEYGPQEVEPILDFLSPLHSLTVKSSKENDYFLGHFSLNMDLSVTENLIESIFEAMQNYSNSYGEYDYYNWDEFNRFQLTEPALFQKFNFSDVDEKAWYAPYVYHMANLGIMKGYANNEFRPAQNITRAEFIKTVITAYQKRYGQEEPNNIMPVKGFSDVLANDWFSPYVNQALSLELITGYNDGTFRPNQTITRAEATAILVRTWENDHYFYEMALDEPFDDVNPTDWFQAAIAKAYQLNLVSGKTPTTFAPSAPLSRAETATLISRYLEWY